MSLDLSALMRGWEFKPDEVVARIVRGREGVELMQLRVDLGVLQMHLEGRPDGLRYRGLTTCLEYIRHELRVGATVDVDDWRELTRELHQFNYRRLASATLGEQAVADENDAEAIEHLRRTVTDIEHCLAVLETLELREEAEDEPEPTLRATLIFNRARLLARVCAMEGHIEQAIETASAGADALDLALCEVGFDDEHREQDSGIAYLRQVAQRLREQHGVSRTLAEQLAEAVAREDFTAAARLRDEIRRRAEE